MAESVSGESGVAPPDPRIVQANERTLLAWLRTGLSLVAFGFVLERVDVWLHGIVPRDAPVHRSTATDWIGAGYVVVGVLANSLAIVRFVRTRRALRMGAELPTDAFPLAFAAVVILLGAAIAIHVISRLV